MMVESISPEEENRAEAEVVEGTVEEPYIKIGMQEVYNIALRVAEGNQRLEAKMDTTLSSQTIQMNHLSQQVAETNRKVETELTKQETEFKAELGKVSDRLSAVEAKPVVTRNAMWTGIGTIAAVVGVVAAYVAIIVK